MFRSPSLAFLGLSRSKLFPDQALKLMQSCTNFPYEIKLSNILERIVNFDLILWCSVTTWLITQSVYWTNWCREHEQP